jgi:glucose-1-phosphate cytidylyltransferase
MVDTGVDTPKGERIRRIAPCITGERFFLTYGDGVSDINLDALLSFHRAHGRWVTVTGYQPRYQYGVVKADDGGLVTAYHQYPRLDHWINAGFMVVEREALDALDPGLDWETGFLVRLADLRQLVVYRHQGFWRKMDTFKEAQELNAMWTSGRAPWKTW